MRTTPPRPATAGDAWLPDFLLGLAKADLAPKTIEGYGNDLSLFARWHREARGAEFAPEKLGPMDLVNYRQHLVDQRGLKPATVNRHLEALRRLSRWLTGRGLIAEDPSRDLKRVRVAQRGQPQGLKDPEVHALLRGAGESRRGHAARNYALVQVLVHAGLRVSEVVSLRVADAVVHERSGFVRIRQGKGRKEREVPLNASARRALRRYLETRSHPKPEAPLFESDRAGPMSVRSVQNLVASLARRARIERVLVTPHTLRHTFSINFLRDNPGKLAELARLLGHESLDTTAIYLRPSAEELAQDVERGHLNVY